MLPRGRPGFLRHPHKSRITGLGLTLLTAIAVSGLAGVTPANAGTDGYPTSIAGCHYANNPSGAAFTCDLKGSTQDSLIDPWREYNRECTSFVAWRLHSRNGFEMPFHDNAYLWKGDAQNLGYTVDTTPAVGAVAWWDTTQRPSVGHVAWVESVSSDASHVTVEQYNIGSTGTYSEQTMLTSSVEDFIHFKDLSSTSGYRSAFNANSGTGTLFTFDYTGSITTNTTQGMASGTNPAVAALSSGGYEEAFQGTNGHLWVYYSAGNGGDTGQGMASGTSPAIAANSSGGYRVAFQANNGRLYYYDSSTGAADTGQGMASGTSPAIASISTGGYEMAFQANTGYLYVNNPGGGGGNTYQGVVSGTSPAIAANSSGGYRVAFEANSSGYKLFTYDSSTGAANTTQGMAGGTSPAIAALSTGGYESAFQAGSGHLFVYYGAGNGGDTGQGMASGTSPAIAAASSGGYQAAFQANTGNLYVYDSTNGTIDTTQGMISGTSPAIAP
jgi:surface antigen